MSSLPRSHRAHLIVVLLTWLVAGASCGSSGNEDSGATTSLPGSGSTGTAYIPTSADDEGETVADLEVEWAANRARVVAELTNGAYGLDEEGDDLSGPGGFELDLDQCPSGWDDKAGLDGGSIKIGVTAAQSGELAAFGDLAVGM
jgi:hypothetical protein